MSDARSASRLLGNALVAGQFTLITALAAWAALDVVAHGMPAAAWGLLAASIALGAWTLWANRPGNFNIHLQPRAGGRLAMRGPYRWIRHPMYTSAACFAAACVAAAPSASSAGAAAALGAVLLTKARLEERWMQERHPGYAAYRASTWRFLPWLL